jgi:hypothetical protein
MVSVYETEGHRFESCRKGGTLGEKWPWGKVRSERRSNPALRGVSGPPTFGREKRE